jgi:plastocyanin
MAGPAVSAAGVRGRGSDEGMCMDGMRTRRLLATLAAMGAVLASMAACGGRGGTAAGSPRSAGPVTINVRAGEVQAGHPEREFLAFYPAALTAHPGDTLGVSNRSAATLHTFAFGVAADRSDQPALIDPGVGFTPITAGPCVSTRPVTAATRMCPGAPPAAPPPSGSPAPERALAAYAAQPFYTSGILDAGQTAVLRLSPSLRPGRHGFVCLLHPAMAGTLTVVSPDRPIPTDTEVRSAGDRQLAADQADAATAVATVATPPAGTVQAGTTGREVTINSFLPASISIAAGQVVTWRNDRYEPHIVVFGASLALLDPRNFGPPTLPPGSDYGGGDVLSGLFGGRPFPTDSYSLRFPAAGTYHYACSIHAGMTGVVQVR